MSLVHFSVGRSLSTSDKVKIDELASTLEDGLEKELSDGFIRQTAKTSENIAKVVDITSKSVDVQSELALF